MTQSMNRRSFLGLGALGALAAGAGLVGCAPKAPSAPAANADSLSDTGKAESEGIARKEGKETKECDVAVVGARRCGPDGGFQPGTRRQEGRRHRGGAVGRYLQLRHVWRTYGL